MLPRARRKVFDSHSSSRKALALAGRRRVRLTLLLGLISLFPACGPPRDSFTSCKEFRRSLECGAWDAAATVDCSKYEFYTCDVSAFFDCEKESFKCVDGSPDTTGWAACVSKDTCNR